MVSQILNGESSVRSRETYDPMHALSDEAWCYRMYVMRDYVLSVYLYVFYRSEKQDDLSEEMELLCLVLVLHYMEYVCLS